MPFITIAGLRLEYERVPGPGDAPTIVLLHEGLGNARSWRDFPARLAGATGCGTIAYSRLGHGHSDPAGAPRGPGYLHAEALEILPEVLRAFGVERPLLLGHSDGATIALIYAAHRPQEVRGLALEAAHVIVEDVTLAGIEAARRQFAAGPLREGLVRAHGDHAEALFEAWSTTWLSPGFRHWSLVGELGTVRCPTLVIQGEADQYGTTRQVDLIAAGVGGPVQTLVLPGCGHTPHREREREVLEAVRQLVARLRREPGDGVH